MAIRRSRIVLRWTYTLGITSEQIASRITLTLEDHAYGYARNNKLHRRAHKHSGARFRRDEGPPDRTGHFEYILETVADVGKPLEQTLEIQFPQECALANCKRKLP